MTQTRHIADTIVDQIVDRLRWGVPTTATYTETGNNSDEYTVGRDRDTALVATMLPFVDVRIGSEQAMPAQIGTYTAEMQVHVDLYCRAVSGLAVSRELERLRLLTQSVLLRPSFKGTAQTAALLDLNMGPYVHSIRAAGADDVSVFQEGETGIGHLRTTYVVRYSVPLPGLQLPNVGPTPIASMYTTVPAWGSWAGNAATISANVATAPDATNTADRIVPTATSALHFATRALVATTTKELVAQFWAKAEGSIDKLTLYPGGVDTMVHIDLTAMTVVRESNVTSAGVTDAGDGWRSIVVTWPGGGQTYSYLRQYVSPGAIGFESFLGDGVSGMLFWGEALTTRNIYIADDETADPRLIINMPSAGNGLSNDLTTFVHIAVPTSDGPPTAEQVRDGVPLAGDTVAHWSGVQLHPGQVATETFDDLPVGSYSLYLVQVARGIVDDTGPIAFVVQKEE